MLLPTNPFADGHSLERLVEMVLHIVAEGVADGGVGLLEEFAEADEETTHFRQVLEIRDE